MRRLQEVVSWALVQLGASWHPCTFFLEITNSRILLIIFQQLHLQPEECSHLANETSWNQLLIFKLPPTDQAF